MLSLTTNNNPVAESPVASLKEIQRNINQLLDQCDRTDLVKKLHKQAEAFLQVFSNLEPPLNRDERNLARDIFITLARDFEASSLKIIVQGKAEYPGQHFLEQLDNYLTEAIRQQERCKGLIINPFDQVHYYANLGENYCLLLNLYYHYIMLALDKGEFEKLPALFEQISACKNKLAFYRSQLRTLAPESDRVAPSFMSCDVLNLASQIKFMVDKFEVVFTRSFRQHHNEAMFKQYRSWVSFTQSYLLFVLQQLNSCREIVNDLFNKFATKQYSIIPPAEYVELLYDFNTINTRLAQTVGIQFYVNQRLVAFKQKIEQYQQAIQAQVVAEKDLLAEINATTPGQPKEKLQKKTVKKKKSLIKAAQKTKTKDQTNRPLSKLASAREVVGGSEHRTAAYIEVREDSSTESTPKCPAEVEFRKRSNESPKSPIKLTESKIVQGQAFSTNTEPATISNSPVTFANHSPINIELSTFSQTLFGNNSRATYSSEETIAKGLAKTPSIIDFANCFQQKVGCPLLLVGGAVRDLLLKQTPRDYDFVTTATLEQLQELFNEYLEEINDRFHSVRIRYHDTQIDVKCLSTKENCSMAELLKCDSEERDFTLNAIYYDITNRRIYDPQNGQQSLKNRTLEMIGDPGQRLSEKPVRIIRLFRLAADKNLTIDSAIAEILKDLKFNLQTRLYQTNALRLREECSKITEGNFTKFVQITESYQIVHQALTHLDILSVGKSLVLSCA